MLEIGTLKKAIWEGYELKIEISGKIKDVDEIVRAEMRVRKKWKYRYPKEHRCFFKWTKYCPEFCNFEKPCEQLVVDDGEEEYVNYGFLVRVGEEYYFSEDFEVNEENRFLIFHPNAKLKNKNAFYYTERTENKFGFIEIVTEIVTYELVFSKESVKNI